MPIKLISGYAIRGNRLSSANLQAMLDLGIPIVVSDLVTVAGERRKIWRRRGLGREPKVKIFRVARPPCVLASLDEVVCNAAGLEMLNRQRKLHVKKVHRRPKEYYSRGRTLIWGRSLSRRQLRSMDAGEVFTLLDREGKAYSRVLKDSFGAIREHRIVADEDPALIERNKGEHECPT